MVDLVIHNASIWTLGEKGTISRGFLTVKDGLVHQVEEGPWRGHEEEADLIIDAQGQILMPGLVDCHTHLMEYGTTLHHTRDEAQSMAAQANLLQALQCGIVALGEHHLGHPQLARSMDYYKNLANQSPLRIQLAFGCCWLGFDPPVMTSSTRPGQVFYQDTLEKSDYQAMALASGFPGEHLFVNYTCANAPLDHVPHAGEMVYSKERLTFIADIFHQAGKRIGAHIEGDEGLLNFIDAGGDVIHHGHNLSEAALDRIAQRGLPMVITPQAGTSKRPTTPAEALTFYQKGIQLSLASDAYIPVHDDAHWLELPPGYMTGPLDYLKVCQPILRHLADHQVSTEEILKMLTLNPRKILFDRASDGPLMPGLLADMIVCRALPGLETTSPDDISLVLINGKIMLDRR